MITQTEPVPTLDSLIDMFMDFPDGTIKVGMFVALILVAGMYFYYTLARRARSQMIISGTFLILALALFIGAIYIFPEFTEMLQTNPGQLLGLVVASLIGGALILPLLVLFLLGVAAGAALSPERG